MTTTQTTLETANQIVAEHTAFGTYFQLTSAMAGGYVPTVSKRRQAPLLLLLRERNLPAFVVR